MCRYIITCHEYTGCRLRESTANDQASREPGLLGRLQRLLLGSEEANNNHNNHNTNDNEPVVHEDSPELLRFHRVRIKTIWQCRAARTNPNLEATCEEKRLCAHPTYAHGDESRVQTFGLTTHRGECPVCAAVTDVIRQETYKEYVVSLQTINHCAQIWKSSNSLT